ncbi:uncharacterized protein LOC120342866 [Styela clava]
MHIKLVLIFALIAILAINCGDSIRFRRFRLRRIVRKVGRFTRKIGRGLIRGIKRVGKIGSKIWKFGKKVISNWSEVKKLISCFKTVKRLLSTFGILGDNPVQQMKILRDENPQAYSDIMTEIEKVVQEEYGEETDEMMKGFDTVMELDMNDLLDLSDDLDQMGNDEILDDEDNVAMFFEN